MAEVEAAVTPAQEPPRTKLQLFVGKWHASGESYGGDEQSAEHPRAGATPWTSDESYEWLPGEYFLLHTWDAKVGEHTFAGTEILGYDELRGYFFTRMFDNSGNHPEYIAFADGHVWTFSETLTRATFTVSPDGDQIDIRWEVRRGGSVWLPLCDRVAIRV